MRIQSVIFAAFATGCCGNIEPETFDIQEGELFRVDLEIALEAFTPEEYEAIDIENLTASDCELLCQSTFHTEGKYYHEITTLDDCAVTPVEESVTPDGEEESDGPVATVTCSGVSTPICMGGRRPLAHRAPVLSAENALGTQLAAMAHMEAASVIAFDELAQQLRAFGAPASFITRCRSAAKDERLHAALLSKLANRYGGSFSGEAAPCNASANLAEIALHNAVEGCVNEAWAACLAVHQAQTAADPSVRQAFTQIARDEIRHAQLAWDLHEWMLSQLDETERARIQGAQKAAIAALREQRLETPPAFASFLGLPVSKAYTGLKEAFATGLAA
jgi:rubrerythrin